MKINKFLKVQGKRFLRFAKSKKRALKSLIFRNRYSKVIKKIAKMEVGKAAKCVIKFSHSQVAIRPRLRLISKFTLSLIIALVISSQAVSYLKAKEPDIKVNGQAILVAEKNKAGDTKSETQVDSQILYKKSPFEFKKPVDGYLSQGYSSYHRANDIAAPFGSQIHPLGAGIVEFAGMVGDGKGMIVVVDHGNGLKSLYAHMGKIEVGVGNQVNTNTPLGTVGLTGRTTGPHVHLEVYDNNIMVDPAKVLPE